MHTASSKELEDNVSIGRSRVANRMFNRKMYEIKQVHVTQYNELGDGELMVKT